MNGSFNPQVAAETVRDTLGQSAVQFEDFDAPVSEAMRALAEQNVARTREFYEHPKHRSRIRDSGEVFRRGGPRRDGSKP
jgi:hypothetical protein